MEERKRGRKEFDEATGEWKVRHGYGSANNGKADYPIMEAVQGDSFADPWAHDKDKRREKVSVGEEGPCFNSTRLIVLHTHVRAHRSRRTTCRT